MPRTVKIRPDQPLFKADAFHMPLWIHAPFEIVRGFAKWMWVSLAKDNPHGNPLDNATFTKPARKAHRNAFWSGKKVAKGPKWIVMAWRWSLVFTVLAWIKYASWDSKLDVFRALGDVLKWVGLSVIPWCWSHWGWLPLILVGTLVGLYGARWAFKRLLVWVRFRGGNDDGTPWYEYVISAETFVRSMWGKVTNRW